MPSFSRDEVALWWAESGSADAFPVILHTGGVGAGSMWQRGGYVERLVLLGDTASDRFTTECVLARARRRYAREGRQIVVACGPANA